MKTQEEYALEIDEIVRRDVESYQSDWFIIDKEIFMQPENKNKAFILGTRKTGCDMIVLGGTNCSGSNMDWLFGCLDNENFYVCQPLSFYKSQQEIRFMLSRWPLLILENKGRFRYLKIVTVD